MADTGVVEKKVHPDVELEDKMQPGREMDALIAEHVMGWKFIPWNGGKTNCPHCGRTYQGYCNYYDPMVYCDRDCHYSTDDDAAWNVVKAMWAKGYEINLSHDNGQIDCDFRTGGCEWDWASVPSFPHAVCMATLRAMGVVL